MKSRIALIQAEDERRGEERRGRKDRGEGRG